MKKIFFIFSFAIFLLFNFTPHLKADKKAFLPHVDVYKVKSFHNIEVLLEYPARLKAYKQVMVVARVNGILLKKFFKDGEFVKKGKVLYEIEPDIYKAEVNYARANLQLAIEKYHNSEKNWERVKALFNDNATSVEKRDNAFYSYKIAGANVESARANLLKALITFNYTKVKAPISGFTGLKLIDTGNIVHNGTPLVTITDTNKIYAEFSIPDNEFIKYNIDKIDKLTAVIKRNGIVIGKGKIDFKDVNINTNTATVQMRAIFENNRNLLHPGEFVRIILKGISLKNILEVPQQAVIQTAKGKIVFTVKNGKVNVVPVITGDTHKNNFIVEKGLKPGDVVIINNFFKIKPGIKVKIDSTVN